MGKKLWEILEENKEANDQEIERLNKKASEDFNRASRQQNIWDRVQNIASNSANKTNRKSKAIPD